MLADAGDFDKLDCIVGDLAGEEEGFVVRSCESIASIWSRAGDDAVGVFPAEVDKALPFGEVPKVCALFPNERGDRAIGGEDGGEAAHRELRVLRFAGIGCALLNTSAGSAGICGGA